MARKRQHWCMKEDREISLARDIARHDLHFRSDEMDEVGRQKQYVAEKLTRVIEKVTEYTAKSMRHFNKFDIRDVQEEIGKLQASLSEFATEAQHRDTIMTLAMNHNKEVQKEKDDYNAEHNAWEEEERA